MARSWTFCGIGLLVLAVQLWRGASASSAISIYHDDEDCNPQQFSRRRYSYQLDNNALTDNSKLTYEEVFDGHRRLIFPKMKPGLRVTFNSSLTGRYIHPYSKTYVINMSLGVLNIPRYIRVFIGWLKFIMGLPEKAKTFSFRLMIRIFRLFVEWPLHRAHLIMDAAADEVAVLKYLLKVMFPEWPSYQIEVAFEGYVAGSASITIVYKRIFRLVFPEWPEIEVNGIFDGTESLVTIMERLVLYLMPHWSHAQYVFQDNHSVTSVIKKMLKLAVPSFNINSLVTSSSSPFAVFEKALMVQFPGWPNENTFLIGWTWLKLLYPYYIQVQPKLTYYKTVANSDKQLLDKELADLKVDISNEISSSPVNIKKIFLMSFGAHRPDSNKQLSSLFDALFGEFSGSTQSTPSISFVADNLVDNVIKIGGYTLTVNWWNSLFPEVPMPVDPAELPVTQKPTPPPPDLGIHGGIHLHLSWATQSLPVLQSSGSSGNVFCREPGSQYSVMPFNVWLQKLSPSDDVLRLLYVGEPGFDESIAKSEYVVPESIQKLLFQWNNYQNQLTMYGKIPITYVIKFFMPPLFYNWPKSVVTQLVRGTNSIRVILQRVFEHIFYSWRPFVECNVTPVHLIFKRLLLLILPDVPKADMQLIFDGSPSFPDIFHRLFQAFFPRWPHLELGYIPKHIDEKIILNILKIIFNWPKYHAMLEVRSVAALPAAIKKLSQLVMPEVPPHEVDMVITNKVGLSLLISRFINILNPAHVIALDVHVHDEHTLTIPYWAFEILFNNWPHYEADISDKNLQSSAEFRRCLNWLLSQIANILHKASCSEPIVYAWVGELAAALLEYSIEALPSVYDTQRNF